MFDLTQPTFCQEPITPEAGLVALIKILQGKDTYRYQPERTLWLEPRTHLFTGERCDWICLVGEMGITADLNPWVKLVCQEMPWNTGTLPAPTFHIYWCQVDHGHLVYFGFQAWMQEWIVGGCTDFSGEGGRGTATLLSILRLFQTIYGWDIHQHTIDAATYREREGYLETLLWAQDAEERRSTP